MHFNGANKKGIIFNGYFRGPCQGLSKFLKKIIVRRTYLKPERSGKGYCFTFLFYLKSSCQTRESKKPENSFSVPVAPVMEKISKVCRYMAVNETLQGVVVVERKFCFKTWNLEGNG